MLRFFAFLLALLASAGQAGAANDGRAGGPMGVSGAILPVDAARLAGVTPVAAHSVFRAMSANYDGPLFKVTRMSDGTTHTVYPVAPGGLVNMADLQSFCSGTTCYFKMLCDQIQGVCTASNDNSLSFGRTVTISQASPGIVTSVLHDSMNSGNPMFLETTGTLPGGLSPDAQYYAASATNSGSGATPVTWNLATSINGSGINTTSAGSGTQTAYTGPALAYSNFPNGTKIPVIATMKYQPGRNRASVVNLPIAANGYPLMVYALFGSGQNSVCCGTYGLMENAIGDTGSGRMFAPGISTGAEGGPCAGTGPWFMVDMENGVFCTDGGLFTMASATTNGTTLNIRSGQIPQGMITGLLITDTTNPSSIPAGTLVNAFNQSGNTITVCVPPGVPPACTGGGTVTVASGDVLQVGYPQPTLVGGFIDGYASNDGRGSNSAQFKLWVGDEAHQWLTNYANQIPSGHYEQFVTPGLSLGEGGDSSASAVQFYEGMLTHGVISDQLVQLIHDNLLQTEWQGNVRKGATYYNFTNGSITGSTLPTGWSFARAACSGTGAPSNCVTDGLYTDAAGRTPNYYTTNTPIINSNGLGLFTQHVNYVGGSQGGSDCNQEPTACFGSTGHTAFTTGSLGTGYDYVLVCNGTGSVTSTAGTATGSGFGTLSCNSGTFQQIHLTGAGTVTLSTSGTINWIDLQDQTNATGKNGAKPHIYCPSTATPPCTAQTDKMSMGSTSTSSEWTTLEGYPNTVVFEHNIQALDNLHMSNQWGPLVGTSAGSNPVLTGSLNSTHYYIYNNSAGDTAYINTTPEINATHRTGFTFGPGMYSISHDSGQQTIIGTLFNGPDLGSVHIGDAELSGVTHYLGFDQWVNGACNCFVRKAAFYPYFLGRWELNNKTASGAALP